MLLLGIVGAILKKRWGKNSLKWSLLPFGMVILTVVLAILLVKNDQPVTEMEQVEETELVAEAPLLTEDSFHIEKTKVEYFKEENKLFFEYKTNLPDDTVLYMIVNFYQPDSWEEFSSFFTYTTNLEQDDVEVTVKDGYIRYELEDEDFNGQLVPNSKMDVRFFIPVSDEVNSYLKEQYPDADDFEVAFPEMLTNSSEKADYEIASEWFSSELTNAHTAEEIYQYYRENDVSYKELEKNPAKFEGTPVSFTGEILQIQTEERDNLEHHLLDQYTVIRLAVNGNLDEVVFITVRDINGMEGIVKDDTITVYGYMTGSITYESVAGYEITIPSMDAYIYEK